MNSVTHMRIFSQRRTQYGLSLIEMMISITIGLVILSTLTALFANQSKARLELDKSNRMLDNGSYALDLLSTNLRLAGFYSEFVPSLIPAPTAMYDPCDTASLTDPAKNTAILGVAVFGYDATTTTSNIASPPCGLTYAAGSDHTLKPGSDILVVRRASTTVATIATAASGVEYLQVSMCGTDTAAPPNNYQIATAPAASFSSMHKRLNGVDCAGIADLRQFLVQTYFVSPDDTPGDGIPTLKMLDQYNNTVTPLVEGIEFMQIEYGIDGDNTGDGLMDDINGDGSVNSLDLDGEPDSYSSTCTACTTPADWANYWSNVVSVRINILARNQEKTAGWIDSKTYSLGSAGTFTPSNDPYKRHTYSQLVRLVNPAGRRE